MTVKVLYLAGWGRSGTTIIDNLLGAHDGFFSAGEVHYLWERGYVEGRTCGCGKPLADCPLWTAVLRAAYGDDLPDPRRVVALQERLVQLRHTPRLLATRGRTADLQEYAALLTRLYRGIAEVTGAEVVVDSSKRPSDGAVLSRLDGIEGYLLHVVRDPRAVAYSWSKRVPQPDRPTPAEMVRHGAAESTLNWLAWNAATEALAGRFPRGRAMRLRYEDFVAAPRAAVGRILDLVGAAPARTPFLDDRTVALEPNHTCSGNPSRFTTGRVTLHADEAWRSAQRPADRRLTTVLALPLLVRYGYRPVVRERRRGPG